MRVIFDAAGGGQLLKFYSIYKIEVFLKDAFYDSGPGCSNSIPLDVTVSLTHAIIFNISLAFKVIGSSPSPIRLEVTSVKSLSFKPSSVFNLFSATI